MFFPKLRFRLLLNIYKLKAELTLGLSCIGGCTVAAKARFTIWLNVINPLCGGAEPVAGRAQKKNVAAVAVIGSVGERAKIVYKEKNGSLYAPKR